MDVAGLESVPRLAAKMAEWQKGKPYNRMLEGLKITHGSSVDSESA